jgi:hypothetical protein
MLYKGVPRAVRGIAFPDACSQVLFFLATMLKKSTVKFAIAIYRDWRRVGANSLHKITAERRHDKNRVRFLSRSCQ